MYVRFLSLLAMAVTLLSRRSKGGGVKLEREPLIRGNKRMYCLER